MVSVATSHPVQRRGEPTWDIARIFPNQGSWSIKEYLLLPGNHLIEFRDGNVEVLATPTEMHQYIVGFLCRVIFAFVSRGE